MYFLSGKLIVKKNMFRNLSLVPPQLCLHSNISATPYCNSTLVSPERPQWTSPSHLALSCGVPISPLSPGNYGSCSYFYPCSCGFFKKQINEPTKSFHPELGILIDLLLSLSVSQTGSPPPKAPLLLPCAFCLFEMKLWCTYRTQSSPSAGTRPHTLRHAHWAQCGHSTRTLLRVFTVAAFDGDCLLQSCPGPLQVYWGRDEAG